MKHGEEKQKAEKRGRRHGKTERETREEKRRERDREREKEERKRNKRIEELGLVTCERIVFRHGAIVNAVLLTLGGDDIVEIVKDREEVDCEREKVEV